MKRFWQTVRFSVLVFFLCTSVLSSMQQQPEIKSKFSHKIFLFFESFPGLKKYVPTTESKCLAGLLVVVCAGMSWQLFRYNRQFKVVLQEQEKLNEETEQLNQDAQVDRENSEKILQNQIIERDNQIKERDNTLQQLQETLQDLYVKTVDGSKISLTVCNQLKYPEIREDFKVTLETLKSNIDLIHAWRKSAIANLNEETKKFNNIIFSLEQQLKDKGLELGAAHDTIKKQKARWQDYISAPDNQKAKHYQEAIQKEDTLSDAIRKNSDEIKVLNNEIAELKNRLKRSETIITARDEEINSLKNKK